MAFNRKQRQATWVTLIVILLCLAAGWYLASAVILVAGGVAVWRLNASVERPEIAVVKSVRCGACGAIGEPHWKACPRCGATDWKTT